VKKALLAALAVIVALSIAEAGLRAAGYGAVGGIDPNLDDPVLLYTQADRDDAPWRDHFRRSQGGSHLGIEPIVAVGDSFTYGLEIEPHETWARRIGATNLGMFGHNACQVDRVVERFVPDVAAELGAKVLVVGLFSNDGERTVWNPPHCGACLTDCSLGDRIADGAVHRTRLGLVAAHAWRSMTYGERGEGLSGPEAHLLDPDGLSWRTFEASVTRLVGRARAMDLPVVAVLFDGPGAPTEHAGQRHWCEPAGALLTSLNVPYLDAHQVVGIETDDRYRARDGRHLNGDGNARIADALRTLLTAEGLVPPRPP
jgi:hypothetical protein